MKFFAKHQLASLTVDMHSHLIPGIDDGSRSVGDSLNMIQAFKNAGYQKLVTTPHIHPNYPNTRERIMEGLKMVQEELQKAELEIELEAAAEYFVDPPFMDKLNSDEPLLTFGDKYLLIECSFINKPVFFENIIFELRALGYKPVFAHPERYAFLEGDIEWLKELKQVGILLQVTLGSLSGYYGKTARRIGSKLIKENMVDFLASDLHRITQFEHLKRGWELKETQKLIESGRLLNESLL